MALEINEKRIGRSLEDEASQELSGTIFFDELFSTYRLLVAQDKEDDAHKVDLAPNDREQRFPSYWPNFLAKALGETFGNSSVLKAHTNTAVD
ncbi:unnamed protein product [Heligmosomoides polygyrus]|uniref:BSD domain-containing protein n=1 Tax=Heligmosomoides polygyrus TaxID=6339 RepID=A0A183FGF2_HELPZ|nr:unnamed protein product [Heligmosomoides polygyrus]